MLVFWLRSLYPYKVLRISHVLQPSLQQNLNTEVASFNGISHVLAGYELQVFHFKAGWRGKAMDKSPWACSWRLIWSCLEFWCASWKAQLVHDSQEEVERRILHILGPVLDQASGFVVFCHANSEAKERWKWPHYIPFHTFSYRRYIHIPS